MFPMDTRTLRIAHGEDRGLIPFLWTEMFWDIFSLRYFAQEAIWDLRKKGI